MSKFRTLLLILLALPMFHTAQAQEKYGSDSVKCVTNISLYREFYRQKNYKDALPYWRWIYQNCPASTEHMYADGPVLLKFAMQNEKDPKRQAAYKDSILAVYDQRIQHYGREGYVLSRKMVEMLTLNPEDQQAIFDMGQKVHGLEGAEMDPSSASVWFQAATILLSQNKITAEQAMDVYSKVNEAVNAKTSSYYTQNQETVQKLFLGCSLATCDVMVPAFQKQFDANPADLEQNKKIAAALGDKCADSDLFFKVSQAVYAAEPSSSAAYNLARMSLQKDKYSEAAKYYNEALDKETDNSKKAQYHYELALAQTKMGQNAAARGSASKAANLRSGWGEPYILIGELIAATKGCGESDVDQKSVFWLAVDKFQQAKAVDPSVAGKANDRISTYSQYFPTNEVIFFNNLKEGQSYTVPCLGETTKVRVNK